VGSLIVPVLKRQLMQGTSENFISCNIQYSLSSEGQEEEKKVVSKRFLLQSFISLSTRY